MSTCHHTGYMPCHSLTTLSFVPVAPSAWIPHWSEIPSSTGEEPLGGWGRWHGGISWAVKSHTVYHIDSYDHPVRQVLFLPHFTSRKKKLCDSQDEMWEVELRLKVQMWPSPKSPWFNQLCINLSCHFRGKNREGNGIKTVDTIPSIQDIGGGFMTLV